MQRLQERARLAWGQQSRRYSHVATAAVIATSTSAGVLARFVFADFGVDTLAHLADLGYDF